MGLVSPRVPVPVVETLHSSATPPHPQPGIHWRTQGFLLLLFLLSLKLWKRLPQNQCLLIAEGLENTKHGKRKSKTRGSSPQGQMRAVNPWPLPYAAYVLIYFQTVDTKLGGLPFLIQHPADVGLKCHAVNFSFLFFFK